MICNSSSEASVRISQNTRAWDERICADCRKIMDGGADYGFCRDLVETPI